VSTASPPISVPSLSPDCQSLDSDEQHTPPPAKVDHTSIAVRTRTTNRSVGKVILTAALARGLVGTAYTGTVGSQKIVAKIARTGFEEDLRHEGAIYESHLGALYGQAVPPCFGLFEGEDCTALITAHCGESVVEFANVDLTLRYVFYWSPPRPFQTDH
jgi:hypothetical protein